jgi:hypothetical protein
MFRFKELVEQNGRAGALLSRTWQGDRRCERRHPARLEVIEFACGIPRAEG